MEYKILVSDKIHPVLTEILVKAGFSVETNTTISYDELLKVIKNYDCLVVRSRFRVDETLINNGVNLKVIARLGSGLENIDVKFAESKNIKCINSPEGNRDSVGEQAMGMLLSLMHNVVKSNNEVRNGVWLRKENWGTELKEKTVGIIGYGNMGSAFAQRLSGFGVNILAYDKYKSNFGNSFVKESTMQDLYNEAEIVSVHLPYNKETAYLVNDNFIKNFKNNIYIINTARGKILKTEDLVTNLKTGKVLGAALDVIEYEDLTFEKFSSEKMPLPFKELISMQNVILTPHVAGWSHQSNVKLAKVLAEKIVGFLDTKRS